MEFVTGVARNVNLDLTYAAQDAAAAKRREPPKIDSTAQVRFEIDGHKIVETTHVSENGRWLFPIADGDSLILTAIKLDEPRSTGEDEVCVACRNLSRGYTSPVEPFPHAYLAFFGCLAALTLIVMTLRPIHHAPVPGVMGGLQMFLPVALVGAALFSAGGAAVLLLGILGRAFEVFRLRRYALQTAAGGVEELKQSVSFPARAAVAWRASDRIAVVGERMTLTRMQAIVYKNLTTGASGAAEGWAWVLVRVGAKLAAAAAMFYLFQNHLGRDFAPFDDPRYDDIGFDLQVWFPHFVPLAGFFWCALLLLQEFFSWRLRREARRRLGAMLQAA